MSKPNIYDEKFSERMKFITSKRFKNNQSEFARAVGVAQASLARWVKGEADPTRTNLIKIAETAGVSLEWLATGKESQNERSVVAQTFEDEREALEENICLIDSYSSINVSAGFGSFNDGVTEPDGQEPYSESLLASLGVDADECAVFWAKGDSMYPTIDSGDQLLVDLSRTQIQGNNIYLVQNEDSVWVKRVKVTWQSIELISDNKEEYKPIIISKSDAEYLQVIGQVVHIGHKLI